jgi:hypothetical protein
MVLNVGFHKALEIPWPDPPLSAFHALCSKDFDIRIIFEDMLEISSKKLSRCQILHEMTNRRWQTRSRGNVNDKVRPASTRTLSLCILWIMWATNILGKLYLTSLLMTRTLLIYASNANITRDSVIEMFHEL